MQQKTEQTAIVRPHSKRSLIILGLLLLICAVSGGVFLWQANTVQRSHAPKPQIESEAASFRPPNPNEGYLVIKEWGVRLKPRQGIEDLRYILMAQNTEEQVGFSSEKLQNLDPGCSTLNAPLGALERSKVAITDATGTARSPTKVIDGYYYYFTGPQASCLSGNKDTTANIELLEAQSDSVATSMTSLEAAH